MTTETENSKLNNQTDNQATFAPLGKYAFIAVIMVGIIVTTAVMLDKQLNKTETEIASIENEIAELNKARMQAANASKQAQVSAKETVTATASTTKTEIDTAINDSSVINNQQSDDATIVMSDASTIATARTNVNSYQSHKVQQRERMTEMFDRIARQESKQLEQFKTQQADQVARLRKQVNVQKQQIDALMQRNESLFNLRLANVQRNQAQREQMLNRI